MTAIEAGDSDSANEKWKKVYGRPFPSKDRRFEEAAATAQQEWRNTEQFIEDQFPIDIRYSIALDCEVSQQGFREHFLKYMLEKAIPLLANKKLLFTVVDCDVPEPYSVKWKILNRGAEAKRRDCIRGQIVADDGFSKRKESTNFKGEHVVGINGRGRTKLTS